MAGEPGPGRLTQGNVLLDWEVGGARTKHGTAGLLLATSSISQPDPGIILLSSQGATIGDS